MEMRREELNEDERLLTSYIRQVVDGQVDDQTYAAMESRLGTRGLFEYAGFILWLQSTVRMEQWAIGSPASDRCGGRRTARRPAHRRPARRGLRQPNRLTTQTQGAALVSALRPAGHRRSGIRPALTPSTSGC